MPRRRNWHPCPQLEGIAALASLMTSLRLMWNQLFDDNRGNPPHESSVAFHAEVCPWRSMALEERATVVFVWGDDGYQRSGVRGIPGQVGA